jgi:hypothetical protein
MPTRALELQPVASGGGDAAHLTRDWQQLLQLGACCIVAGITALVVAQSPREVTPLYLLTTIGAIAAGVVVAVALLRLIDVLALRRQIQWKSRHAEITLDTARHLLEAGHPDIGARAVRIDAKTLLERALRQREGTTSSE